MKFFTSAISHQHLYLKAAIFITGLVTGLDSSFKQLLMQTGLFILAMLLEPALYLSSLRALKRIIPFLAAYWVGATLFKTDFIASVTFSVQLIYLILVTVWVFARQRYDIWAWDSRKLRRIKWVNSLFAYQLYTVMYVKQLFAGFGRIKSGGNANQLFHEMAMVYQEIATESNTMQTRVQGILNTSQPSVPNRFYAHLLGLAFLAGLAVIHGV